MDDINPLHLIDTNCNDCKYLVRDNEKNNKRKQERKQTGIGDRYLYGFCQIGIKPYVFFSPSTCMPENEQCFKHRKL